MSDPTERLTLAAAELASAALPFLSIEGRADYSIGTIRMRHIERLCRARERVCEVFGFQPPESQGETLVNETARDAAQRAGIDAYYDWLEHHPDDVPNAVLDAVNAALLARVRGAR